MRLAVLKNIDEINQIPDKIRKPNRGKKRLPASIRDKLSKRR